METLQWSVVEYEEKERSADWFWALGIIIVAGSIAAIIFGDFFFAILLVVGGACLAMFAVRKPETITYELDREGLKIKGQLYPYKNIKSFFVRVDENPALFIRTRRIFMPIISTVIHTVSPVQIRETMLANDVPEEEMKEHASEKIMERLGI